MLQRLVPPGKRLSHNRTSFRRGGGQHALGALEGKRLDARGLVDDVDLLAHCKRSRREVGLGWKLRRSEQIGATGVGFCAPAHGSGRSVLARARARSGVGPEVAVSDSATGTIRVLISRTRLQGHGTPASSCARDTAALSVILVRASDHVCPPR